MLYALLRPPGHLGGPIPSCFASDQRAACRSGKAAGAWLEVGLGWHLAWVMAVCRSGPPRAADLPIAEAEQLLGNGLRQELIARGLGAGGRLRHGPLPLGTSQARWLSSFTPGLACSHRTAFSTAAGHSAAAEARPPPRGWRHSPAARTEPEQSGRPASVERAEQGQLQLD